MRDETMTTKTKSITLSTEQEAAKNKILKWWKKLDRKQPECLKLAGYAGTGKTTLIKYVISEIREKSKGLNVAYCAFTGKASTVMRSKLDDLGSNEYCGTIHGLVYRPVLDPKTQFLKGFVRKESLSDYNLIVIDEASMVNKEIFDDISKYKVPILAVGDHGQLPPVSGNFNLMGKPDVKLETIHRQAEDNPIIKLSMVARKTGRIKIGDHGPGVQKIGTTRLFETIRDTFDPDALYLCAFNATRVFINQIYRESMNIRSKTPIKGEKVICLKNNREAAIYNGLTGILKEIKPEGKDLYNTKIEMDDDNVFEGKLARYQFGQKNTPQNWKIWQKGNLFDWGYCLTVHKAQGSEAKKVILIEQRMPSVEDHYFAKWLYTAVTRASQEILIIKQEQPVRPF